jgi:mono/diheme cytochrome c family protein
MAMIVLKGLQGAVEVKGQQYGTAVMQPWDKTLTDKQIGDVMT